MTKSHVEYKCRSCGWVYPGKSIRMVDFQKLSDEWECPKCGSLKSTFVPDLWFETKQREIFHPKKKST